MRAEKLKVQNDGRVLFYNWLRAKGQVAVAEKSLEQVQARQKDAKTAYSLGAISKADLMRLEALVANTELMVKQAETLQQLTDAQLGIYMGDKTPRKYTIGEDVLAPAAKPVNGTLPALERSALRRRRGEVSRSVHLARSAVVSLCGLHLHPDRHPDRNLECVRASGSNPDCCGGYGMAASYPW